MYKRSSNMWIPEYINESEKRLNKVKTFGGDMSVSVLAYKLLKNENLKQSKEQSWYNEWMNEVMV